MSLVKTPFFIILFCTGAIAGDDIANASKSTQWVEDAKKCGLSPANIDLLNTKRILISDETYRQIFSAYLSGERPLFITSDSLLNAYHVLYEESILRLENVYAGRLPGILKLVLNNIHDTDRHLKGNPALVSAAKQRAMLTMGVALKLIDDTFQFDDTKLNTILSEEVERIIAAKAVYLPEWLAKPDTSFVALDYSRYKPRGFYLRSERLKRHFRAVSWLQSIPFRIGNDVEFLSALMLGSSVDRIQFEKYSENVDFENFFSAYSFAIGAGDNWDLMKAAIHSQAVLQMDLAGNDLQEKRAWLEKIAEGYNEEPMIDDQIKFAPDNPANGTQPQFRIISPYRTPSAILFQRTTDPQHFNRSYPTGLEVAASLGSTFARQNLGESGKEDLLKVIDSSMTYFECQRDKIRHHFGSDCQSLYLQYLKVLKALLDKPEPDMPDFMKTKAWEAKNCNTALSGWAQLRHTWVLHAKQNTLSLFGRQIPVGFVEPEPEFFSRMADLVSTTRLFFNYVGAFNPDYGYVIHALESLKGFLADLKDESNGQLIFSKLHKLSSDEMVSRALLSALLNISRTKAASGLEGNFREQMQWIDAVIEDIKKGAIDKHPDLIEVVKEEDIDLKELWEQFEIVSRRLEAIAHKQLRTADLNTDETAFIRSYGKIIATIMLYSGNSYNSPRDDSPRIVDICSDPQTGTYLHVGIARPRKLYVLYPWKGETVLCEGAVMPYIEFVAAERLTDDSWKERLDSGNMPLVPKWLSPVISEGGLKSGLKRKKKSK